MPDLSPSQARALEQVMAWYESARRPEYCSKACDGAGRNRDGDPLPHTHGHSHGLEPFTLAGLAGTGKTFLSGQLAAAEGLRAAFGTPTHRARAVLTRKLPDEQSHRVKTYHSLLFRANPRYHCSISSQTVKEIPCSQHGQSGDDCECNMTFEPCSSAGRHSPYQCRIVEEVTYEPRQLIAGYRNLIVLDEASMIGQGTLNDVLAFGVPVVLVGDPGQLQPVKEQPNRYMMAPDATLKENFRQAEDNGIVDLALMARQNGRISLGRYGDGSTVVASWVHDPAIMDCVNPARLTPGPDTAVITWQRKTRAVINKLIHGLAAGSDAMVPVAGDRVIALQNVLRPVAEQREDGSWNLIGETHLHNNAMGTVRDAWRLDRRLRTIRLVVELDETSSGRSPGPLVVSDAVLDQFGAHDKLRPDQRPRANNMLITLWDFAYAATCHTSQGNEFSKVAVIEETANLPDYRRWMYTAASRAREKLIVLTGRV